MVEAVEKAGYKLGEEICFAMDLAASEFYNAEKGVYELTRLVKVIRHLNR